MFNISCLNSNTVEFQIFVHQNNMYNMNWNKLEFSSLYSFVTLTFKSVKTLNFLAVPPVFLLYLSLHIYM